MNTYADCTHIFEEFFAKSSVIRFYNKYDSFDRKEILEILNNKRQGLRKKREYLALSRELNNNKTDKKRRIKI